jgi:hypothetical protein
MSLGTRRTLVAAILSAVVLAVIGLIYLQVIAQNGATRSGWLVTREVQAGAALDASNVRQVRIPGSGDQFLVLNQSPIDKKAAHNLQAQTLLRSDDVVGDEVAMVPVSLRSAPPLQQGQTIDVFATGPDGRTVQVGRRLVVVSPSNPVVLEVQASTEQAWITLQANNVPLFATRSPGLSVGSAGGTSVGDALAQLTGSNGSSGPTPPPATPPPSTPRPTPTP